MTNKDEALKMAIEYFEFEQKVWAGSDKENYYDKPINACKEALERPSNMVAVPLDKLKDMQRRLNDCEEYLKEDETPAECIARNRKDTNTTLKLLAKCMGEKKALEQPAQEPVSCHCGNPAFNPQSITHTKTKCFQHSLQNPVAWTDEYKMFLEWDKEILCDKAVCKEHEAIPLYTHPHQWQGLTDDEINEIVRNVSDDMYPWKGNMLIGKIIRAIEQAIKEKNT
jgi:hypothetical protein